MGIRITGLPQEADSSLNTVENYINDNHTWQMFYRDDLSLGYILDSLFSWKEFVRWGFFLEGRMQDKKRTPISHHPSCTIPQSGRVPKWGMWALSKHSAPEVPKVADNDTYLLLAKLTQVVMATICWAFLNTPHFVDNILLGPEISWSSRLILSKRV